MKRRSLCVSVGCPNVTTSVRCAEHSRDQERQRVWRNQESRAVYATSRWRKLRKRILARDRFCRCPLTNCHGEGDCMHVSKAADHIVPMAQGGAPFDPKNLRGVCTPCHTRIGVFEQRPR
jgi:5-methylcytosine-specific restriction protein A